MRTYGRAGNPDRPLYGWPDLQSGEAVMSEDPLEGWLPPQAPGGGDPTRSDKYRASSTASWASTGRPLSEWKATRRRADVRLGVGAGTILTAALLAALNAYVFAWYARPECCVRVLFSVTDAWVNVILVLSAIGALVALLAGIAVARVLVKGTGFFEVRRAAGPWIVLGLLTSAGLFYLCMILPWSV